MYYTPQAIIDQINNRIAEPAVGSGALLVAAVRSVRHPVISNPPFSAGLPYESRDASEIVNWVYSKWVEPMRLRKSPRHAIKRNLPPRTWHSFNRRLPKSGTPTRFEHTQVNCATATAGDDK